mmetsp:Transcript_50962/g.76213  ORF Transcript_50962/g.76213 Transcript_50962/m.76213 type:complete len:93 (-) Transcript_50962:33-311(-)
MLAVVLHLIDEWNATASLTHEMNQQLVFGRMLCVNERPTRCLFQRFALKETRSPVEVQGPFRLFEESEGSRQAGYRIKTDAVPSPCCQVLKM